MVTTVTAVAGPYRFLTRARSILHIYISLSCMHTCTNFHSGYIREVEGPRRAYRASPPPRGRFSLRFQLTIGETEGYRGIYRARGRERKRTYLYIRGLLTERKSRALRAFFGVIAFRERTCICACVYARACCYVCVCACIYSGILCV